MKNLFYVQLLSFIQKTLKNYFKQLFYFILKQCVIAKLIYSPVNKYVYLLVIIYLFYGHSWYVKNYFFINCFFAQLSITF